MTTGHPCHSDDDLTAAFLAVRADAVRRLMAASDRRGGPPGTRLTGPQHLTLAALAAGPLGIGDLASATGVAVSSATRMVQGLERLELVAEAAVRLTDRRRRRVELTPAGRIALDEKERAVATRVRQMIASLSDEERDDLLRGLRVMRRALGRLG